MIGTMSLCKSDTSGLCLLPIARSEKLKWEEILPSTWSIKISWVNGLIGYISIICIALNTEMFFWLAEIYYRFSTALSDKIQAHLHLFHTSQDTSLDLLIAILEREICQLKEEILRARSQLSSLLTAAGMAMAVVPLILCSWQPS